MSEPLKIGVLYPWTGLPEMDRGSARRVVPIVSLLAEHFESVEVLSPGDKDSVLDGNIKYTFYHPGTAERWLSALAFRLFEGTTYHLWRGRVPVRQRRQWWHYLQPRFQPSLGTAIRRLVSRADVVLLEYPFWSALLPQGAKAKPVILTLHDVLSGMISQPWLKRKVHALELKACRRADAVVCCTEADAGEIRAQGFHTDCVPHGIDLNTQPQSLPRTPTGSEYERIDAHRKQGGLICFFVGSSHDPNREAVEEIRKMSGALSGEADILFVAAGSCCGRESQARNLILLGPVAEGTLDWLYSACDVVLAPLLHGTGSSLKTLEALARRKILVGSGIGARGYDLVSGRDAILCDDFSAYPAILIGLMNDKPMRKKLSRNGWDFVQAFDSRKVYLPYVDVIKKAIAHQP
ncbi:MAG: glycosyltransferase family 4 protein [Terrimicrobiaceae bacterium]